ncbi:MAG: hypothetical protein ABL933_09135 [Methyloglobulus sp.]|nr:hypothetical protein [Methyloglobulus sp.]
MKKIIILSVGIAFSLAIFSAQAVDLRSLAEIQKANNRKSILIAEDISGKCTVRGDSNVLAKNATGSCKASESAKAASEYSMLAENNLLIAGAAKGTSCISRAGSKAGVTGRMGAFCLAADINALKTPPAHFSVGNALPMKGLQFMQVSFRDGSKIIGSIPLPRPGTAIGSKCISVGGSRSSATGKTGDFCIAADLMPSVTAPVHFSVANSLAVASLQILQVAFRDAGVQTSPLSVTGAKCISIGGSNAVNQDAGGFCLASDLKTPSTGLSGFAVANKLSAASLQFLQVSFRDRYTDDGAGHLLGTPMGAECRSFGNSTASTGAMGEFCLVSKLSTLSTGFANFSMANDLPVEGLQFLQVQFADGKALAQTINDIKCKSAGGSTSAIGNTKGFCLTADRRISSTNYANLSVANNLPITALQFVQIPFRGGSQAVGLRQPADAGAATGMTVSDAVPFPTHQSIFLPDFARIAGRKQQYFGISEAGSKIVMHTSPIAHSDNVPVFWISR